MMLRCAEIFDGYEVSEYLVSQQAGALFAGSLAFAAGFGGCLLLRKDAGVYGKSAGHSCGLGPR